jgi:hypothetical protein
VASKFVYYYSNICYISTVLLVESASSQDGVEYSKGKFYGM